MNEIEHALGGFARWMNKPVTRAQVFTWKLANDLQDDCPPIRIRKPYRTAENLNFRIRLARIIKAYRENFKTVLPIYDESRARYIHSEQPIPKGNL